MFKKVLILGAAGRDFHNFNTVYRGRDDVKVVAFTATQIPKIDGRRYPAELAGPGYPDGIPILPEDTFEDIVRAERVDEVVFAYSDVAHEQVMHMASRVLATGADFCLLGDNQTMIPCDLPVISVTAARTGCGKSQTSRALAKELIRKGKRVSAIRHPMPYGDLAVQAVQRFAEHQDLIDHKCTIEEIEEYESYIAEGLVIYAGVDYQAILDQAVKESDVILWDGGNNDTPFYRPDLDIVVLDPLRPGHEAAYHPGEANLRRADVVLVNKVNSAKAEDVARLEKTVAEMNPKAKVILADSLIQVDNPEKVKGKRVLVIEDGPTVTHGGMGYGAGLVAAEQFGAAEIIDPRPFAVGSIAEAYIKYPHMERILPALGYFPQQLEDLKQTIEKADCDLVIIGTPVDLTKFVAFDRDAVRVTYALGEREGQPSLADLIDDFLKS
jgi:predicted GTPase